MRALHDAVWASARAAGFAARCGMSSRGGGELAIVVSELATNCAKFAGRGLVSLRVVSEPYPAVELVVRDHGPGLADPEHALLDGFSEGRMLMPDDVARRRGLGSGLSAVRRLTDHLQIERPPTGGTSITVLKRIGSSRTARR